jgi:hypothetical protein
MLGRNLALLVVLAVVATFLAGPAAAPAAADDDTGAIIAGMIIGGLIGAALSDHDRDRHGYRPPYYRYDPPRCERRVPAWTPYNHGYRDGWRHDRDGWHGDRGYRDGHRYDGHGSYRH